jgi:hypothetical protein
MSNPTSLLAYPEVRDALDRALQSERGIRVNFRTLNAAKQFIGRAYSFRMLDRIENAKIYPDQTHTLHGRSMYDVLRLRIRDISVEIVPVKLDEGMVEVI